MSLKKIAELTGASVSTVSRVLNNAPGKCASKELRDKIWAAARETMYAPNAVAQALRRGDSEDAPRKIAIITARLHSLEADPFFYELFMNVQAELFKSGCVAERADAREGEDFIAPKCDGMVILGRCSHALLARLKDRCENIVGIWRNPTDFDIDEVMCDGKRAAAMAVEYLLKLGHRSIAYIGDCSYESRYVGYCETLIKNSMPINYPLVFPTNQLREEGRAAMEKVVAGGEATAVFCANDITAAGALDVLNALGRKKPKIAVVSIDDTDMAQETEPLLTTIRIPREDMAHMAINVLLDRLSRGHRENLRVEFPCRLVRRRSCFEE